MPTTDKTCEHCGKPLERRTISLLGHEFDGGVYPCDCPGAVADCKAAEAAELERKKEEACREMHRRFDRAHIPPEHRRYKHPMAIELAERIKAHRGLYIVGDVGRRKTTLACGICCELIIRGMRGVEFLSAADLASKVRSSYGAASPFTEDDLLARYGTINLLVLDDLGKGEVRDYSVNMLFRVLEHRAWALKPTIITSQFERDQLGTWLDRAGLPELTAGIISRLNGQFDRIYLDGPDYRLAGKA